LKKYNVLVREVHISHREIKAASKKEALERVCNDEGEETFLEYSHTMDTETWSVEEIDD